MCRVRVKRVTYLFAQVFISKSTKQKDQIHYDLMKFWKYLIPLWPYEILEIIDSYFVKSCFINEIENPIYICRLKDVWKCDFILIPFYSTFHIKIYKAKRSNSLWPYEILEILDSIMTSWNFGNTWHLFCKIVFHKPNRKFNLYMSP